MDINPLSTIIVLIILVLFSAFFSAAETAYTCVNKVRLKSEAEKGNRKAEKVLQLAEDFDRLISCILVCNNVVNILGTSIATVLFVGWLGDKGVSISTIVMTVLVLLFGEVAPKTIAKVMNEEIAIAFYPLLKAFCTILTPVVFLIGCWQKLFARLFKNRETHSVTEDELITMVQEAEDGGGIDREESELIQSAIEFGELTAADVLTPRVDLTAIEVNTPVETIANTFLESGFSRLPVYEGSVDNIIGVLHEKDFTRYRGVKPLREMISKPLYAMPTIDLDLLLKRLQKSKGHMCIVEDEYGGVMGIVTLEDILEELVGEIWDEHDEIVEECRQVADNVYVVQGSANLQDMLELWHLDKEYESITVNGWVLEEMNRFPTVGDKFDCEHLHVVIEKVDKRRVQQIRVEVTTPEE